MITHKPEIHLIHNLACVGGTVLAKCIGSMKNIVLLNDIHPLGIDSFHPLQQAHNWFDLLTEEELSHLTKRQIDFPEMIKIIHHHCQENNQTLVIRDWAHLDFMGAPFLKRPTGKLLLAETLRPHFTLHQICINRHPLDQYISLSKLQIMQGCLTPKLFLEGVLQFAKHTQQMSSLRYEDFTRTPSESIAFLCSSLGIPFDPSFIDNWASYQNINRDTGNNLRGSHSPEIKPLPRKPVPAKIATLFNSSKKYEKILSLLGYPAEHIPSPNEPISQKQLREKIKYAVTLSKNGKLEQSKTVFLDLINQGHRNESILQHLATIEKKLGNTEAVIQYLKELLLLNPESPQAHYNISLIYRKLGNNEPAKEHLLRATQLKPDFASALDDLGILYHLENQNNTAKQLHQRAIEADPEYTNAWNNLGIIEWQQGNHQIALQHITKALELNPRNGVAHINLGGIYKDINNRERTIFYLEKALEIMPDNPGVCHNLGSAYQIACRHAKAREMYRRALKLDPGNTKAHSDLLFNMHYDYSSSREEIYQEHCLWREQHTSHLDAYKLFPNIPVPHRPLRIAYISPDFKIHSVSRFIEPVIACHNPKQFKIFLYSDVEHPDPITDKFQKMVHLNWRDISQIQDVEVAELIRRDRIDILIELAGHTGGSRLRLMARKPAPVQITYLGYPDTTGLQTIDYRLTDELCDPIEDSAQYHTEELYRLPESFLCFQPMTGISAPTPPPSSHTDKIIFGSFNSASKISPDVIEVWAQILHALPNSKLFLKSPGFEERYITEYFVDLFKDNNISADRILFMGHAKNIKDHLDLYSKLDIALDPFPYCGTTTTFEALWMGRPVVTLKGQSHVERVGHSILSNLGLHNCIADSKDDYVQKVIALASDKHTLTRLSADLRKRMQSSILTDSKKFTTHLESAYRTMWQHWCKEHQENMVVSTELEDGLKIFSENNLDSLPTYVLQEQKAWYEPELEFVKTFTEEGMNSIDVGSSGGIYALTTAKASGNSGQAWAFQGAPDSGVLLQMNAFENKLHHLQIVNGVIAEKTGSKMLDPTLSFQGEKTEIPMLSLDSCPFLNTIRNDVHFIHLGDTENPLGVLSGGKKLLSSSSPLILFNALRENTINDAAIAELTEQGYRIYTLIPTLNVIGAIEEHSCLEPGHKLFACKDYLADTLRKRGLLVKKAKKNTFQYDSDQNSWNTFWKNLPYAERLQKTWDSAILDEDIVFTQNDYYTILQNYIEVSSPEQSKESRFMVMQRCFSDLKTLSEKQPTFPRLLSLSRLAAELGIKTYCINLLTLLFRQFQSGQSISLNEYFLSAAKRYDLIDPEELIGEWCLSSIIEQLEIVSSPSSYFNGDASLERLNLLQKLPFFSSAMEQRKQLILMRSR
jgi:predicted O-linked N-acetylglucosamine transferase (SPINDLY family)